MVLEDLWSLETARGASPAHEHFDLRYAFRAQDDAYRAGSDAMAARWVPIEQVHQIESDESVQRSPRRGFAR